MGSALDDDFFDDLADMLVEGDFGAALAFELVDELKRCCGKNGIRDSVAARAVLPELLKEMLQKARPPRLPTAETGKNPRVILLLGVNGVGKTTTAAKLARQLPQQLPGGESKVILAAADTFRAAAIEQLKIHGEQLGIRVIAHNHGGDPAAVVYDALEAAKSGKYAYVIADTAGRMHTKTALVEELKKIDRVAYSKTDGTLEDGRPHRWLVLDATTGSNALVQAETFHEAVELDGVILSKMDSSAKGGIVFQLAAKLRLPVLYICDGEKYENIHPFNADEYIREFLG